MFEASEARPPPGSKNFVAQVPGSNPTNLLLSLPPTASGRSSNLRPGGLQLPAPQEGEFGGLRCRLCGRRAAAVCDSNTLFEPSFYYQTSDRSGGGIWVQLRRASHRALQHRRFRAGEMAHRQRENVVPVSDNGRDGLFSPQCSRHCFCCNCKLFSGLC